MGEKKNTKSTMTITNTCIFDPPLYMIEKTFLSYCKLSFKYLIKVYFSYGSVLMKEMQKSTTTWFLPFVACLTFGIKQDILCWHLMTYRSCWAKSLNCQHMGAKRWITNNKGNTPGLSQTPSRIKHGTTSQRSSTGIINQC